MTFIKLHKTNQSGEYVNDFVINSEQIVEISPPLKAMSGGTVIDNATQISTADGKLHWVQETLDQVLGMMKKE
jgi:hypothetical protein